MKITITDDGKSDIEVHCLDHYSDHLSWDEALGCVAFSLVHGSYKPHPFLKTKQQWEDYEKHLAEMRERRLSETERQITEHATS